MKDQKENIVLIGMPGSGKSTVGVILAKVLGYTFVDSDLLIQKEEKQLLKDIIAREGQDGFLRIENRVNKSIDTEKSVIATGGSVVYCQEAMEPSEKNRYSHISETGLSDPEQTTQQSDRKRRGPEKRPDTERSLRRKSASLRKICRLYN